MSGGLKASLLTDLSPPVRTVEAGSTSLKMEVQPLGAFFRVRFFNESESVMLLADEKWMDQAIAELTNARRIMRANKQGREARAAEAKRLDRKSRISARR